MAKITFEGIDDTISLLDDLANMPDEIIDEMLIAGGKVAEEALRESTMAAGVYDTGQTFDSITLGKPKKNKTIDVYFKGTRENSKVRNAEVAFVNEYGVPSKEIAPRQFIRKAQEDAAEPATEAATRVFDEYMEQFREKPVEMKHPLWKED